MDGMAWGMALGLALGGSLHCMGMCGGFALMANARARGMGFSRSLLAYFMGKTLAYTLMGAVAGSVGAALGGFRQGGVVLAWVAGLALLAVAGHLLGWSLFRWVHPPVASAGFISRMAALLKKEGLPSRFAMGVFNGWLPCGLVYAALAMAMGQGNVPESAAFMALFGLGTVPSLWLAAQITGVLSSPWKVRLSRLSGWLVAVFGVLTILRGSGLLGHMMTGHL